MNSIKEQQHIDEFLKCAEEPLYFIRNYCYMRHPTKGKLLFDDVMYDKQVQLIQAIHENRFSIVSKCRQCGASTMLGSYALWLALFNENTDICIISRKDSEAKIFKKRQIDFPYENLPEFLKSQKKKGVKLTESVHTREFFTGSTIRCEAGPNAGRGGTFQFIIIDEAGFVQQVEETWSAIYPTISVGRGKAIVNSTSSAIGTWYANQWHAALAGDNDFQPISIDWNEVPHFAAQPGWLEEQEKNLTPHSKFRREILRDFIVEGDTFVPGNFIKSMVVEEPIRCDFLMPGDVVDVAGALELPLNGFDDTKNYMKNLWIWKEPTAHNYMIGVDVAHGTAGDNSALQVIDTDLKEQVAEYRGKVDTNQLAIMSYKLGRYYNNALIAVEYNSMGSTVFNELDYHMQYENLYWRPKNQPGWYTNSTSRDAMLNSMYKGITHSLTKTYSARLKEEVKNFITMNGKSQAASGTTDDLVMAFSIAVHLTEEYGATAGFYDIHYESVTNPEDGILDQSTQSIKEMIENNTDFEVNMSDYGQYKWMY